MSQFGTVIPRLMLIIDVVQLMSQFGTVIRRLMLIIDVVQLDVTIWYCDPPVDFDY